MIKTLAVFGILALTGCATDAHTANQICARTAGCVFSFAGPGYGPIQAQAVAPTSPGPLQPQR